MSTGVSVGLAALGAALAFAVRDNVSGVDLTMLGYILMIAGALGVVLGLVHSHQVARRQTSVTEQVQQTPNGTVRTSEAEVR